MRVKNRKCECDEVLDDKNVRRRFRASNYQSTTRVKPFICTMPMRLDEGWNQIQFNLSDFTRRAYGTNYVETLRVQVTTSPACCTTRGPYGQPNPIPKGRYALPVRTARTSYYVRSVRTRVKKRNRKDGPYVRVVRIGLNSNIPFTRYNRLSRSR